MQESSVSRSNVNPGSPRTILGVFAHPDDETFGPGGALARLAAEGHTVHLLCATRGEAGTIGDSGGLGRRNLASIREEELAKACRALGIHSHRVLTLPDSGLARLDEETLVRPFVGALRALQPELLLSFHAEGISGHPDHRTVTARAATAFDLAAEAERWPELGPPHAVVRFWTYGIPESKARRITHRRIHAVPDEDVDALIDVRDYVDDKRAAVAAHATQKPFIDHLETIVGGLDEYWGEEAFVLERARIPLPPAEPRPVSDLLVGMDDS
jgi:LmbE family N-acetylglucosaminyl deacetylase